MLLIVLQVLFTVVGIIGMTVMERKAERQKKEIIMQYMATGMKMEEAEWKWFLNYHPWVLR